MFDKNDVVRHETVDVEVEVTYRKTVKITYQKDSFDRNHDKYGMSLSEYLGDRLMDGWYGADETLHSIRSRNKSDDVSLTVRIPGEVTT